MMVATDRISAFDHILPAAIPYKGQVLNGVAAHFLRATQDLVPNWLIATPHQNVAIGRRCTPIKLEMVIRGYLTGHAWRTYKSGKRTLCGVVMAEGLRENDALPEPIITPTTKADMGHDMDISEGEILDQGIVTKAVWEQLCNYTRALFQRGSEMARDRGLILVDTKYEFGYLDGKIVLMDEIHTPDSSRYFYADGYEDRQRRGEPQQQLSKEFVREWLMSQGFQGRDGDVMPVMPATFVQEVSERYIQLYEMVTGKPFEPMESDDLAEQAKEAIEGYLNYK